MEIDDIKKHRSKLESDLLNLIRERFEEFKITTGISPYAITVHVVDMADRVHYQVGSVVVSIKATIDL